MRKWFGHDPEKWAEFCQRYLRELEAGGGEALDRLVHYLSEQNRITLVFAAKDTEHNNAVALKQFIDEGRIPRNAG